MRALQLNSGVRQQPGFVAMNESVEQVLARYRECAALHASIDYGSRATVERANRAVDTMRELASNLGRSGPAAVTAFARLLEEREARIDVWAAHHLLELMTVGPKIETRALAIIEREVAGDSVAAVGNRVWLERWRAQRGCSTSSSADPVA